MKYYPTPLEQWIWQLYKRISITEASEISEEAFCHYFRIYLFKKSLSSFSYEQHRYKAITIDDRLSIHEQREVFFHELCHLLRHAGWQFRDMPLAFKELQEWDANRFVSYAALPVHMVAQYDLQHPDIIQILAEAFKVTPELCEKRLTRIVERAKARA
ncbi:ImmA/IrrE family metallo-endopeptidase [Bacillus sp. A301a_S52]|nr:ImmA/IrrE family metallo-endopeptidase [Bacillus sp. A301a_S52]